MSLLTATDFRSKWEGKFADNEFQNITEATFREFKDDVGNSFAAWQGLSVKRVKGATYPVPFLDRLDLVPPEYRILGMEAVARNGVNSGDAAAGAVGPPVFFALIRDSQGDIDAFLDEESVLTTKAVWVRVSGTPAQLVDSFPPFAFEDHVYKAGDRFKYTFGDGITRLFEVRADIDVSYYVNPLPSGDETDPFYIPFAPLGRSGLEHVQNTDAGTTSGVFTLRLDTQLQEQGEQRTVLVFEGMMGSGKGAIGWFAQDGDGKEPLRFEQCLDYTGTPADAWLPLVGGEIDFAAITGGARDNPNLNAELVAIDGHRADLNNPHSVTAGQVGLGQVTNTSDEQKVAAGPIAAALNAANQARVLGDLAQMSAINANTAAIATNGTAIAANTAAISAEVTARTSGDAATLASATAYTDQQTMSVRRLAPTEIDASTNPATYPTTGGTGTGGTIRRGDQFYISVPNGLSGTVAGVAVEHGDAVEAVQASPSSTNAAHWRFIQANLFQATEGLAGTARLVTTAIAQNENTADDARQMTALKSWQMLARFVAIARNISGLWNFTVSPTVPLATTATQAAAFGQIPTPGTGGGNYAAGNDSRLTDARATTWTSVRGLVSGVISAVAGTFASTDTLEVWLGKLLTLVNANTGNITTNTTAITALQNQATTYAKANSYTASSATGGITLDFGSATTGLNIAATGNLSFGTSAGKVQGGQRQVNIVNSTGASITVTLNTNWTRTADSFTLLAGKRAALAVECVYGTAETDIICTFVKFL